MRIHVGLLVSAFGVSLAACSSAPGTEGQSSSSPIASDDAIARAEEWVAAQVPYCQSANHQPDGDHACASVCNRADNADWDPYRSDCSGLVSWAWGLPAPGRTTSELAPAVNDITHAIDAALLAPGDAVNIPGDHMMLFKEWVVSNQTATFIEEPGCSSATPYAHEFTSAVTLSGDHIHVARKGLTFTAIHYGGLTSSPPPDPGGNPPPPPDPGNGGAPDAGVDSGSSTGSGTPCASDGDCNTASDGSGQMCVSGACVAGCNADWECPGITTCVSGQCQ